MERARLSGILLHPTSFPGRLGIGDLGNEAYRLAELPIVAEGLGVVTPEVVALREQFDFLGMAVPL